jgi:hypothetical protein
MLLASAPSGSLVVFARTARLRKPTSCGLLRALPVRLSGHIQWNAVLYWYGKDYAELRLVLEPDAHSVEQVSATLIVVHQAANFR